MRPGNKPVSTYQKDPIDNLPANIKQLAQRRDSLGTQIKSMQDRLSFGFSEPLNRYKIALMREDLTLLAQMTDELCAIQNHPQMRHQE